MGSRIIPSSALAEAEIIEEYLNSYEHWMGAALEQGGYEVTGTTSPDFDGSYFKTSDLNAKSAYTNKDGNGFLWWDGVDSWIVSAVLGTEGTDYFKRTDASAIGAYTNEGSATGTVTGADIADEAHVADHMVMTPFQMDAGNDALGAWLQILGSEDTPHVGLALLFNLNQLQISDVETDKTLTIIQIGFGDTGAAALASDDVTEKIITPLKDGKQDPFEIRSEQIAAGTKAWIRCWVDGQNTSTVDFHFAMHEYDE